MAVAAAAAVPEAAKERPKKKCVPGIEAQAREQRKSAVKAKAFLLFEALEPLYPRLKL